MRTIVHLMSFQPRIDRTMDTFLLRLTEGLAAKGWRSVYVFSGEPEEAFARLLGDLDAPYYLSSFPLRWRTSAKLAGELRPHRLDVMQTMFMSPYDPPLWWLKSAIGASRWVVADHSSGAGTPKAGLKRLVALARGRAVGAIIDKVIAVSDFVARRDVERNMLPARKMQTIYNGVDLERFQPIDADDATGRPLTVAFVGQLIREKGLDVLIEAIGIINRRGGPRLLLKVAGSGPAHEELVGLAETTLPGQVEFLGQIRDVPGLFRSVDLAVFPSRWEEAFAFVTSEAMACGTPVVTSDAGGLPEVVGGDGSVGLTFRNGDAEDLAGQLTSLVEDPARLRSMRAAARKRAVDRFALGRMVDEHISVYESLVLDPRRSA